MFNIDLVKPRPNLRRQESGRLCPSMGIISTTEPMVISQREVDMKRSTRTGQRHVEDASLFFETFRRSQCHIRRHHSVGSVEEVYSLPFEALG